MKSDCFGVKGEFSNGLKVASTLTVSGVYGCVDSDKTVLLGYILYNKHCSGDNTFPLI